MITVRLSGGIGNQMFQYAAGRALSLQKKEQLQLDISYFDFKIPWVTKRSYSLDIFDICVPLVKKSFFSFVLRRIFKGRENFQSPKYFSGYEDILRQDFKLRRPLSGSSKILFEEIKKSETVGVHVRRGDYVGSKFHNVISKNYYDQAIKLIAEKTNIKRICVFSDDINWCRENLSFAYPTTFIGNEHSGKHGEGHLIIMSACKNLIIANSTFSWWAAWLSDNPSKIIIAPKKWFGYNSTQANELIPKDWIRI